jgi:hypothetical protein
MVTLCGRAASMIDPASKAEAKISSGLFFSSFGLAFMSRPLPQLDRDRQAPSWKIAFLPPHPPIRITSGEQTSGFRPNIRQSWCHH